MVDPGSIIKKCIVFFTPRGQSGTHFEFARANSIMVFRHENFTVGGLKVMSEKVKNEPMFTKFIYISIYIYIYYHYIYTCICICILYMLSADLPIPKNWTPRSPRSGAKNKPTWAGKDSKLKLRCWLAQHRRARFFLRGCVVFLLTTKMVLSTLQVEFCEFMGSSNWVLRKLQVLQSFWCFFYLEKMLIQLSIFNMNWFLPEWPYSWFTSWFTSFSKKTLRPK